MTSNHKSHAFIMCHYNTAGIKTKVLNMASKKKNLVFVETVHGRKRHNIRRTRVPIYT